MAVKIKNARNFEDEVTRESHLQAIEAVATTDQLAKIVQVASNPEMVAMLDNMDF